MLAAQNDLLSEAGDATVATPVAKREERLFPSARPQRAWCVSQWPNHQKDQGDDVRLRSQITQKTR